MHTTPPATATPSSAPSSPPRVTLADVQRRIARIPRDRRGSNSRRVKFWLRVTEPVARVESPYTEAALRAINAIDWLPHGAGLGFGGDVTVALAAAERTGLPHARYGYVRLARGPAGWEVFVAPKMTRATVSADGRKWHFAPDA